MTNNPVPVFDQALNWLSQFPPLLDLDSAARALLIKHARIAEAPVGTIGYSEGMPCDAFILRLAGSSRVYKMSSSGREIQLYRVGPGDTCVLTTTCLLGKSHYPASTVVEQAIRDVVVPASVFHQLMLDSAVFRGFVMQTYGAIVSDLIVLLDEVAFHSVNARLAKYLMDEKTDIIGRTHQQIADDLGTAREVISRQLKAFEQKAWLKLGRSKINVINRQAISCLAANA
jgi:CRP/FNR family transcriptional regulator, anaerobic regulatory protein